MSLWGDSSVSALNDFKIFNIESNIYIYNFSLPFCLPRTKSHLRIGPHNYNVISIIIGALLGDAFAEKHGNGTRICFQQEHTNSAYLLWFHHYLSELGYCNPIKPKIQSRLGKKGKLIHILRFKTYTYSSFNWIHESFYNNSSKIVPTDYLIEEFLSPLSLSVWIQDDGCKSGSGLKLSTNSFSYEEVLFLSDILRKKYNLKVSVQKSGVLNQYVLYISKFSMENLVIIIKPFLHPSMYYKLNVNIKN